MPRIDLATPNTADTPTSVSSRWRAFYVAQSQTRIEILSFKILVTFSLENDGVSVNF